MFRALALRKLLRFSEANAVLDEMLTEGDNFIKNCDRRSYYGVGSPSPLPFENNIIKNNLVTGYILKAFALLGYGRLSEADQNIEKAARLNPYDFRVYVYRQIMGRIL